MALPSMTNGAQAGVEAAGGTLFRLVPTRTSPIPVLPDPSPCTPWLLSLLHSSLVPLQEAASPLRLWGDKEVMS